MSLKQIFLRNVKDAGKYEMSVELSPSESIEQEGFRKMFSDLVRNGLLTVDVDGFRHTYEITDAGDAELQKLESTTLISQTKSSTVSDPFDLGSVQNSGDSGS